MPKYCKECWLQGHDENTYWNVHPKLMNENNKEENLETSKEQQIEGGK